MDIITYMRVGKSAATCFFIIKENAANRPRVQMPEFFQTLAEVKAASGRFLIDQTAAEMRADGLTKRGISRKMGTCVRILPRNADGMKTVRSNDERKEEEMAFSCVLYLKEECDGCGICEAQKQTDNEET